jgi:hypothetical protein
MHFLPAIRSPSRSTSPYWHIWADERSTQEYLAIGQQLVEPDPLRLHWRDLIRSAVREVVTSPQGEALELIERATAQAGVPDAELADLRRTDRR